MKNRRKNVLNLNKLKPFQVQMPKKKQFLTKSIDTSPSIQDSYVSFDRFVYKDHVTLRNYPLDQLKKSESLTRQTTQVISFFNIPSECQDPKRIEQLELWKKIQQNRNKILVNSNRKKTQDTQITFKDLSNRENHFDSDIKESDFFFQMLKSKTTQNPLIEDNFSISKSHRRKSQQKLNFRKKEKETLNFQSLIKLKRKVNNQLQKINKKIFRDYLIEKNQEQLNFHVLARESYKFPQKVKKLKTLMQILETKNDNEGIQSLVQLRDLQSKNPLQLINGNCFTQRGLKSNKIRSKTQLGTSEQKFYSKKQVSLQRFKKSNFYEKIEKKKPQENKKCTKPCLCLKSYKLSSAKKEQLTKDIEQQFTKSCQIIDEQIKLKFHHQMKYSLSVQKQKQKHQFS